MDKDYDKGILYITLEHFVITKKHQYIILYKRIISYRSQKFDDGIKVCLGT